MALGDKGYHESILVSIMAHGWPAWSTIQLCLGYPKVGILNSDRPKAPSARLSAEPSVAPSERDLRLMEKNRDKFRISPALKNGEELIETRELIFPLKNMPQNQREIKLGRVNF